MTRFRMAVIGLVTVLCAGFVGLASPAQAQLRMCGPGETPIGWDRTNPQIPVPLCGGNSSAPPAPQSLGTFAGFAYHRDASDLWVDGSYTGPDHYGPEIALERCNRAMGGGCQSGGDWGNSWMAVYRNGRGDLFWTWEYDKAAVKRTQAECRGQAFLPCERVHRYGSKSTREHFPGPEVRKRYLAAVWVQGLEGYDGKLYMASGEPTYADALGKAMAACEAATARKCELVDFTGDGFVQTYRYGKDHAMLVETTAARAKKSAEGKCKKAKFKCEMTAQYDARNPGLFVHDFNAK